MSTSKPTLRAVTAGANENAIKVPARSSILSRRNAIIALAAGIFAISLTLGWFRANEFSHASGAAAGQAEVKTGTSTTAKDTGTPTAEIIIAFALISTAMVAIAGVGRSHWIDVLHRYELELRAMRDAVRARLNVAEGIAGDLATELARIRARLHAVPADVWRQIEAQLLFAWVAIDERAIAQPHRYGAYRTREEQKNASPGYAATFLKLESIPSKDELVQIIEERRRVARETESDGDDQQPTLWSV